jgi:hypothetical protein
MIPDGLKTALLGALIGAGGAWGVQGMRIDLLRITHDATVARAQEAAKASELAAAQQELKWAKEKDDAENEARKRLAQAETERAALAAATGRLRRDAATLRARLAGASATAHLDAGATTGELLATCAEEYRSMADQAQRHANDVRTLIAAWPSGGAHVPEPPP